MMKMMLEVLRAVWWLLRALSVTAFYATPVVGFWVTSSLAAYLNGPSWAAWVAGLTVFPVLPLVWELRAWRRTKPDQPRWFTLSQRLSMRTFAVGLAFLGALLSLFPRAAFVSLSTRGDWMLDGVTGPRADTARRALFAAADGLEWLYRFAKKNPYEAFVEQQVDRVSELVPQEGSPRWPWKQTGLHPVVAAMTPADEASIEAVARHIARSVSDPFERVKALHDWVADRIAYDAPALFAGSIPRQDARTIFEKRVGVCAGYANLLAALGAVINEKIVVVTGDARDSDGNISGAGHAWNAAQIEGRWYLIDATWDSGHVSREKGFTKSYSTEYLFPPARLMVLDHFPREARWQLLATPVSQGDFLRQPMMRPAFYADGLELVSPRRAQTEASRASVLVKNPWSRWMMMQLEQNGRDVGEPTEPTSSGTALMEATLPGPGTYRAKLFVGAERSGRYRCVGTLEFVNGS